MFPYALLCAAMVGGLTGQAAAAPAPALAASASPRVQLVARWDQPVRYHAEALVMTPKGFAYISWVNLEASARRTEVSVDLSCVGSPVRRGTQVRCTLDKVSLAATVVFDDQADLDAIMAEYQGMLQGQEVQLLVGTDGRIMSVDLEGVDKRDDRMARIHEAQRQILRRVLTPLDLGLPRNGDPRSGTWKQRGIPMLFQLMTAYGTAGGTVMKHTLEDATATSALISSEGRGNVATGLEIELGAGQVVNMVGVGSGSFDIAAGQVGWRQVSVTGELTASSILLGDPLVYSMAAWAGRIADDGTIESGVSQ